MVSIGRVSRILLRTMTPQYKAIKTILDSNNRIFDESQVFDESQARQILDQLLPYSAFWDDCRDDISGYIYGQLIRTIATSYEALGFFEKAVQIANDGVLKMEEDSDYHQNEKIAVYEILGRCYSQLGDKEKAVSAIEKIPYYNSFQLNTHWPRESFYSFRSVSEYSLQDLRNNTVSLSSVSTFNDPVDSSFFPWIDKQLRENNTDNARKMYLEAMKEAFGKYRARCFVATRPLPLNWEMAKVPRESFENVAPYCNTLMWAHYSNYHKGFCVEYNIPSDVTCVDVRTKRVVAMRPINYVDYMPYKQELSFEEAFLTKSKRWEYEHEARMIYFKQGDNSANPIVSLGTDYEKSIRAVYIGMRCHKEHEAEILDIMRAHPSIPVYRMKVSNDDIYSLERELIAGDIRETASYFSPKKKPCWFCLFLEKVMKTIGCKES